MPASVTVKSVAGPHTITPVHTPSKKARSEGPARRSTRIAEQSKKKTAPALLAESAEHESLFEMKTAPTEPVTTLPTPVPSPSRPPATRPRKAEGSAVRTPQKKTRQAPYPTPGNDSPRRPQKLVRLAPRRPKEEPLDMLFAAAQHILGSPAPSAIELYNTPNFTPSSTSSLPSAVEYVPCERWLLMVDRLPSPRPSNGVLSRSGVDSECVRRLDATI